MAKKKDDKRKQKIIGAAAGVAAAGVAAGLAVARSRRKPTVYRVQPGEDGWTLEREGAKSPESTHRTKRGAVKAGRKLAGDRTPSQLVIHRADGSVQREHAYGIEE